MTKNHHLTLLLILTFLTSACGGTETPQPTPSLPLPTQASSSPARTLLPADALLNGFAFDSPVDEFALAPPADSAPPTHVFEGRLELLGEKENGHIEFLRGELDADYAYLPEFDFEFVQENGWLIPVQRGLVFTEHPISATIRNSPGTPPCARRTRSFCCVHDRWCVKRSYAGLLSQRNHVQSSAAGNLLYFRQTRTHVPSGKEPP